MEKVEQLELMGETLEQACSFNDQLVDACNEICDHFHQGRQAEGVTLLRQFLQGIGHMSEAIHLTQPLQAERGICLDLAKVPILLEPVIAAIEDQDYGLVGDLLIYEIQPLLDVWGQELRKVHPNG